jgi:hypothetical protein
MKLSVLGRALLACTFDMHAQLGPWAQVLGKLLPIQLAGK